MGRQTRDHKDRRALGVFQRNLDRALWMLIVRRVRRIEVLDPPDAILEGEPMALARAQVDGCDYVLLRFPAAAAGRLTPKQRAIIRLIADGLPTKAIALQLCMGKGTLETHLKRLFRKFQVHSRAELLKKTLPALREPARN
jgi:DNA-binding CsgD family transcriptional regulator